MTCPVCHRARPYVPVRVVEPIYHTVGTYWRCPCWDDHRGHVPPCPFVTEAA